MRAAATSTSGDAPHLRAANGHASLQDAVFDRLLRERIVFLGTQVDDDVANQICAQMLLLAADDARSDIHLYINSPGGSVSAGMAVYDTMQFLDCDVATYSVGMAASMGQFLLTAGAAGKRFALPHTRIMMHQVSAGVGGTQSDITHHRRGTGRPGRRGHAAPAQARGERAAGAALRAERRAGRA